MRAGREPTKLVASKLVKKHTELAESELAMNLTKKKYSMSSIVPDRVGYSSNVEKQKADARAKKAWCTTS